MKLAAQIDQQNTVTQVIVCDNTAWAASELGGVWVAADNNPMTPEKFPGIGYTYDPATGHFTPPPPDEFAEPINEPTSTKKRSRP